MAMMMRRCLAVCQGSALLQLLRCAVSFDAIFGMLWMQKLWLQHHKANMALTIVKHIQV